MMICCTDAMHVSLACCECSKEPYMKKGIFGTIKNWKSFCFITKIQDARTSQWFSFNSDSLHARLNSHYEAWSYTKKKHKKHYSIHEICLERNYT